MTLSAAHRPLNPPFRRAPVSNVRRDKVGKGIRRGVFGTFCGQKVQSTPRAKTAVNSRPKSGKQHQSKTAIGTFCGQKVQSTPRAKTAVVLIPLQARMRRFKTASRGEGGILREHGRTCEQGRTPLVRMFACSQSRIHSSQNAKCRFSPHLALTITFHYTHYMGECPL